MTAANTDEQIDELLDTLTWLQDEFDDGSRPLRTVTAA
jgi:hypothetical protein